MIVRNWTICFLNIGLGIALLIGLLPISNHMLTMPAMRGDAMTISRNDVVQGTSADNSTGSCCDLMGASSLACDVMFSHSACVALYGGGEQVVNSEPIARSIYLEAISPPPKF